MTRLARAVALACLLAAAIPQVQAEIIDRIVAVVGTRVVTESEMSRHMRIQALLAGVPTDYSPSAKQAAVQRLVRQLLVRNEMETGGYPLPPMDEINKTLDTFRSEHYADAESWNGALKQHDVTEDDVREAIRLQLTMNRFINFRFSPSIYVSLGEVEDYYKKHAGEMGGQSLGEVRDAIESVLREEKINVALDKWLEEARESTNIEIREDVLQ